MKKQIHICKRCESIWQKAHHSAVDAYGSVWPREGGECPFCGNRNYRTAEVTLDVPVRFKVDGMEYRFGGDA